MESLWKDIASLETQLHGVVACKESFPTLAPKYNKASDIHQASLKYENQNIKLLNQHWMNLSKFAQNFFKNDFPEASRDAKVTRCNLADDLRELDIDSEQPGIAYEAQLPSCIGKNGLNSIMNSAEVYSPITKCSTYNVIDSSYNNKNRLVPYAGFDSESRFFQTAGLSQRNESAVSNIACNTLKDPYGTYGSKNKFNEKNGVFERANAVPLFENR